MNRRHNCKCLICGHEWRTYLGDPSPLRCAKCKSPYWNRGRKKKVAFALVVWAFVTVGLMSADPTKANFVEHTATTTPVELLVYEVGDVPERVTASEVALWYIESITDLLDAGINQGDVEVMQGILDEQHMYARAVMINEATK